MHRSKMNSIELGRGTKHRTSRWCVSRVVGAIFVSLLSALVLIFFPSNCLHCNLQTLELGTNHDSDFKDSS